MNVMVPLTLHVAILLDRAIALSWFFQYSPIDQVCVFLLVLNKDLSVENKGYR